MKIKCLATFLDGTRRFEALIGEPEA